MRFKGSRCQGGEKPGLEIAPAVAALPPWALILAVWGFYSDLSTNLVQLMSSDQMKGSSIPPCKCPVHRFIDS